MIFQSGLQVALVLRRMFRRLAADVWSNARIDAYAELFLMVQREETVVGIRPPRALPSQKMLLRLGPCTQTTTISDH